MIRILILLSLLGLPGIIYGQEAGFEHTNNAINSMSDYRSRLSKFKNTNLNVVEIKELISLAESFEDREAAQEITNYYFQKYLTKSTEDQLFTKANLDLLKSYLGSPESKIFKFFMSEAEKINAVIGDYAAQYAIMMFIEKNYFPDEKSWKTNKVNWDLLEKKVVAKFGLLAKERIYEQRMVYYFEVEDWINYGIWFKNYFESYLKTTRLAPNNFCWLIFEKVSDQNILRFACDNVMPYTLEKWDSSDYNAYDTYANLLYKTGRRDLAIEWEEKSVKLSNNNQVMIETLEKMKNNIKTWPDMAAKL